MKRIFTIILSLGVSLMAMAQASTYQVSTNSITYSPLANPIYLSSPGWDDASIESIAIGFRFNFMGTDYSFVNIDPNGNLYFGNKPLEKVIDVFGADLKDLEGDADTALILKTTIGSTAGMRVTIFEWRNVRFKSGDSADYANFQVWLNESDNSITFAYGKIEASEGAFGNGSGPFCGIWDDHAEGYVFLHGDPASPDIQRDWTLPFPKLDNPPAENSSFRFYGNNTSARVVEQKVELQVYPNPANDQVTLKATSAIENVTVFTVGGQQVQVDSKQVGQNQELNTSGLSPGIYILQVQGATFTHTERLVISD